jgi:hypothetical protein
MRRVIVESPFAAANGRTREQNIEYARACLRDSLRRGEAPFASHILYTQDGVLDDDIERERRQGIEAGLSWAIVADATVVYTDYGISDGMRQGIRRAKTLRRPVELRRLNGEAK